MAQPFDCLCGAPSCRGRIAGAKDMTKAQLEGLWLNGHIVELLEERKSGKAANGSTKNGAIATTNGNGTAQGNGHTSGHDATTEALKDALYQVEKAVEAIRAKLASHTASLKAKSEDNLNGAAADVKASVTVNAPRDGPSSRELGGEMGGDTRPI